MLIIGTTTGIREIDDAPARRWFFWQRPQHRHHLAQVPITHVTRLPQGGALAVAADHVLWYMEPGQERWQKHAAPSPTTVQTTSGEPVVSSTESQGRTLVMERRRTVQATEPASMRTMTTAIAAGVDGILWNATAPATLWRRHFAPAIATPWSAVNGVHAIPHAPTWWGMDDRHMPIITAIVQDPRQPKAITIAVAVGGIYHSEDGGQTWQAQHRGITPLPGEMCEDYNAQRDVVSLHRHPSYPDLIYATTESAVYRSDTRSDVWEWQDITPYYLYGMLSGHSPIIASPHRREQAYLLAPQPDRPERGTVWTTHDNGDHWEAMAGAPVFTLPEEAMTLPQRMHILVNPAHETWLGVVTPEGDVWITKGHGRWQQIAQRIGQATGAVWVADR